MADAAEKSKPDTLADIRHFSSVRETPAAHTSSANDIPRSIAEDPLIPEISVAAQKAGSEAPAVADDNAEKEEHRAHRRHKNKHHRRDRDGSSRADSLRDTEHDNFQHQARPQPFIAVLAVPGSALETQVWSAISC